MVLLESAEAIFTADLAETQRLLFNSLNLYRSSAMIGTLQAYSAAWGLTGHMLAISPGMNGCWAKLSSFTGRSVLQREWLSHSVSSLITRCASGKPTPRWPSCAR